MLHANVKQMGSMEKTGLRANKISRIPFEIPKSQNFLGSLNICDLRKSVKVWQNLYILFLVSMVLISFMK